MSTKIRMKVISVLEEKGYTVLPDGTTPNIKTINLEVVSTSDKTSPNFPYSFWSSGTKFPLKTINKEASDQFQVNGEFDVLITRAEPQNL